MNTHMCVQIYTLCTNIQIHNIKEGEREREKSTPQAILKFH